MASKDDMQMLSEAQEVYKAVLVTFRECYNLCCYSSDSILSVVLKKDIEQCGVDFRYICEQTTTLAERINSGFIDNSLLFFGNEEAMKSTVFAQEIAGQAAELATGFAAIRDWVKDLAGRCNGCMQKINKEGNVHLENVTKALEDALDDKRKADEEREKAAKLALEKEHTQLGWGIAAWVPVVNFVAIPMYILSRGETAKAVGKKSEAEEGASSTEKKRTKAECVNKKAQVIVCFVI